MHPFMHSINQNKHNSALYVSVEGSTAHKVKQNANNRSQEFFEMVKVQF